MLINHIPKPENPAGSCPAAIPIPGQRYYNTLSGIFHSHFKKDSKYDSKCHCAANRFMRLIFITRLSIIDYDAPADIISRKAPDLRIRIHCESVISVCHT